MINDTSCCGVREYDGLEYRSPDAVIDEVAGNAFDDQYTYRFVLLTDVVKDSVAPDLVRKIKAQGLGHVIKSRTATNPNTGNKIACWLWELNITGLKKYNTSKGRTEASRNDW